MKINFQITHLYLSAKKNMPNSRRETEDKCPLSKKGMVITMEKKLWYKNSYRRGLVDMHISDPKDDEDWVGNDKFNDEFFSEFSPEEYFKNLKKAKLNAPMIYLQSHAGHCYFPTKVGHMHSAFIGREDMIKKTIDLCRADGMNVVGYYSLIFNTCEEDKHPEWRLITAPDGTSDRQRGSRYGHCCPNNPGYREFIKAQIKEMADYFTLDGMFYDMTYWSGTCYCEHCMKKYKEEGFETVPAVNYGDKEFLRFTALREKMIGDFAKYVTELTNEYMPGLPVEHNYAFGVAANDLIYCSTELVNEWCDYTGGDLYGDLYNHSFTAKYYYNCTKNQPFEYMTCRCDKTLGAHTNTKSEAQLTTEIMLTVAHHGASLIIDAIDPKGTLDARVYDRLGNIFSKQIPLEKYFRGEMIDDVGVYYATTGRCNAHAYPFNNKHTSIGATRALIEGNIPVGVLSNPKTGTAAKYKMIIAGMITRISDKNREDMINYVKNGGTLYISGAEEPALLSELLGAKISRFTDEKSVYLAPTNKGTSLFGEFDKDHPFPTEIYLPVLEFSDDNMEVLATMTLPYTNRKERKFASIHSNPPGVITDIPALVEKSYGNGKVIWSAFPIEIDDRVSHKNLFRAIVKKYVPSLSVKSDAPRQVEIVSFKGENEILISAVDLLCTDELLPVKDFSISAKCEKKPSGVYRIENGNEIPVDFTYEEGYASFNVKGLVTFDMYIIKY